MPFGAMELRVRDEKSLSKLQYGAATLELRQDSCKAEMLVICPGTFWFAFPSISLPCRMSTRRLKCDKKFVPKMGLLTSAMCKSHWKLRRSPKSSWRSFCPNVAIGMLSFAAESVNFDLLRLFWGKTGITETSALVLTKNLVFETRSVTNKRRVLVSGMFCADGTPAVSFPWFFGPSSYRVWYIFWPLGQNACDTNSVQNLVMLISLVSCCAIYYANVSLLFVLAR